LLYSWRSVGGAPGLPDGKGTWRGGNLETLSADGNDTSAKSRRVLIPWGKLERLAQTSADLHLGIGEFAVHEGGERALYAVLAGKMEVVKLVDGIERTLGWRVPGNIFGEVPIALGTPFPGGYRASEPSRVIRVDVQQYYEVAAVSPKIAEKIGALARERIGGLQGLAAEPPKARVTMVGHRWDTSCSRLRHFLASNHITYDWMTPDAPEMPARWSGSRPADDECPVLKFVMGRSSVDPARVMSPSTSAFRRTHALPNTTP
jgi:thioredoxin reductase (NADPH)